MSLSELEKFEINARVDVEVLEEVMFERVETYFVHTHKPQIETILLKEWKSNQIPTHAVDGYLTRKIVMEQKRLDVYLHDLTILLDKESRQRDALATEESRSWSASILLPHITLSCKCDVDAEFYESQWKARGLVEKAQLVEFQEIVSGVDVSIDDALKLEDLRLKKNADNREELERSCMSDRVSISIEQISAWMTLLDECTASVTRVGHIVTWRIMNLEAKDRWALEMLESETWQGLTPQLQQLRDIFESLLEDEQHRQEVERKLKFVVETQVDTNSNINNKEIEQGSTCDLNTTTDRSITSPNSERPVTSMTERPCTTTGSDSGTIMVDYDVFQEVLGGHVSEIIGTVVISMRRDKHDHEEVEVEGSRGTTRGEIEIVEPTQSYDKWWSVLDEIREETQTNM
eukprot:PhF_6_TR5149/c0_g1_i1/m.7357